MQSVPDGSRPTWVAVADARLRKARPGSSGQRLYQTAGRPAGSFATASQFRGERMSAGFQNAHAQRRPRETEAPDDSTEAEMRTGGLDRLIDAATARSAIALIDG